MNYFSSDTHFDHRNVIPYCGRPFTDVEEMNQILIANWNARVRPEDTVYFLGDFHMGRRERIAQVRAQLQGRIILVKGNHDRSKTAMLEAGFDEVHSFLDLRVDGLMIRLQHKPPAPILRGACSEWDYVLHGHVHNAWNRQRCSINVGVDVRGFKPVTLAELLADTEERIGDLSQDDDSDVL